MIFQKLTGWTTTEPISFRRSLQWYRWPIWCSRGVWSMKRCTPKSKLPGRDRIRWGTSTVTSHLQKPNLPSTKSSKKFILRYANVCKIFLRIAHLLRFFALSMNDEQVWCSNLILAAVIASPVVENCKPRCSEPHIYTTSPQRERSAALLPRPLPLLPSFKCIHISYHLIGVHAIQKFGNTLSNWSKLHMKKCFLCQPWHWHMNENEN